QAVEAVEVRDDAWDCGADDRLVEGGQQKRKHGAGGGQDDPPPRQSCSDRLIHFPSSFLAFSTSNRHRCRSCARSSLLMPSTISNCLSRPSRQIDSMHSRPAAVRRAWMERLSVASVTRSTSPSFSR